MHILPTWSGARWGRKGTVAEAVGSALTWAPSARDLEAGVYWAAARLRIVGIVTWVCTWGGEGERMEPCYCGELHWPGRERRERGHQALRTLVFSCSVHISREASLPHTQGSIKEEAEGVCVCVWVCVHDSMYVSEGVVFSAQWFLLSENEGYLLLIH